MKLIKKCILCGGKEFNFLFKGKDNMFNFSERYNIQKCKNCNIIFINPQPTEIELKKHYSSNKYYSFNKIRKKDNKRIKLKLFLYDLYFNPKNNRIILKFLLFPLKLLIRRTKIEPNAKILDIGCGSGQFLYEMKQFGMKVYGIEPGNFDFETSKKEELNIKRGLLKKAGYPENFFDIITLNHVLEHMNCPDKELKEIYRILKPRGELIIGVPNTRSLSYFLFKEKWYPLDIPRHLFDYSDRILVSYLNKIGFKVIRVRYNSKGNYPYLSALSLFKGKIPRTLIKLVLPVFFVLSPLLNLFKFGDSIEVYCKKMAS